MSTDARVSRFLWKKGSQKISLDCPFKYSPTQMSFVHPYKAVLKSKNTKGVAHFCLFKSACYGDYQTSVPFKKVHRLGSGKGCKLWQDHG